MQIQWYPGHMTKAKRSMEADKKLVDLIIELTDARVPASGRNPDIDRLAAGKARLILLNKADMADEERTAEWTARFQSQGITALAIDARQRDFKAKVMNAVLGACREKLERDKRRGIQNRPIRAMVVGIPNVGKSTFINSFAGKAAAKTGNKPGVTKGNQWIVLDKRLELLDTPGILWPKFEDQTVGLHLAMIGSISDEVIPIEELALELIALLADIAPGRLNARYGAAEDAEPLAVLEQIARRRGCLRTGNEPDYEKAARALLDDFRSGRLGKLTLEYPKKGEREQ